MVYYEFNSAIFVPVGGLQLPVKMDSKLVYATLAVFKPFSYQISWDFLKFLKIWCVRSPDELL